MSEATEEIQRLTNEVERLEAIDTDRERHFALFREKVVNIEQQFNVMASERDRFNASINRIAEIVGLSGKQCFAPEAVERKAKHELATLREENEQLRDWRANVTASLQNEGGAFYEDVPKLIAAMRDERDSVTERLNEAREHRDQEQAEVERLKRAAVDCDFRILNCPVLKGEDLDLLDPMEVCPEEEADWQDGNKEVYGPGTIPGIGPSEEIVLADQGEPVVAVRKGTDFGCDNIDARPHSRCSVCDGSGTVPGAFLSHVRQPCETCGGTGNELGPPFPMCHKMPECPNKECPHFKLEDNRCGRKAEDHVVRNPPLMGPVDEK